MSPLTNKQLEVKMNQTSFLCGNHNGHHNMELKSVKTHNRATQKTKMI
jgi:hypothetical protein